MAVGGSKILSFYFFSITHPDTDTHKSCFWEGKRKDRASAECAAVFIDSRLARWLMGWMINAPEIPFQSIN